MNQPMIREAEVHIEQARQAIIALQKSKGRCQENEYAFNHLRYALEALELRDLRIANQKVNGIEG